MIFGMPFLLEHDTVEDACRLCRELGLSFVELNANFPPCRADRLDAAELLRLKARYGIDFTFHVEEECDPFAFQPAIRQAWRDVLRQTLRLAREADMPVVNMHLPHGVYITLPTEKAYLYQRYPAEYRAARSAFRNLCEQELQGGHTRIAVENTDGFRPHEQETLAYLLESPVFGLTLDIGHLHGAGECDLPVYEKHEDRLIHMHGHDALGRKNHLPLGEGEIDLKARFAWAEARNARVVVEVKTAEALRMSVRRLHEWL